MNLYYSTTYITFFKKKSVTMLQNALQPSKSGHVACNIFDFKMLQLLTNVTKHVERLVERPTPRIGMYHPNPLFSSIFSMLGVIAVQ